MAAEKLSGQGKFKFRLRPDLTALPADAKAHEVKLHGTFAIDGREGRGELYYGMPGHGLMRIQADLARQELIALPAELKPLNFHSTKLGEFDGKWRLFLSAEGAEKVAVLSLEGKVEFILPRPEFEQYRAKEVPYKPTDSTLVDDRLFVADGYGANFISIANVKSRKFTAIFGGITKDPKEDGKFSTAHGLNRNPVHKNLDICDRPNSRVQVHAADGKFLASHRFPAGSFLCGIAYFRVDGRWYGVIGCLKDAEPNRPAPVYILDAETYELLSIVRPKEELGVELATHIHNAVVHVQGGKVYLVVQSWNPGHYFVLERA